MDPAALWREQQDAFALMTDLDRLQFQEATWKRRWPFRYRVPWKVRHPITDADLMWLYRCLCRTITASLSPLLRGRHMKEQYPLDRARLEAAWRDRGILTFTRDPTILFGMDGLEPSGSPEARALMAMLPREPLRPLEVIYTAIGMHATIPPGVAGTLLLALLGPVMATRRYDRAMSPLIHDVADPPPDFCHELLHMLWLSYIAENDIVITNAPDLLRMSIPTNQWAPKK